ncbi:MAG: 2-oxoacid:acceptor oxidoreductase family protein [Oscillospiraceae bacterium]|nr:2-oxoacid:acceptor oxidoreductase family protein [Oscillospiraceae bacterium]
MKEINARFAGFGGQGILFLSKLVAYCGIIDGREVSTMPSYGPEMRGGTVNSSVRVSDTQIYSPIVDSPELLVVMNLPSYLKFIDTAAPGGTVVIDSSLVSEKTSRTDIDAHYIPATALANENGLQGLANIIMLGKILALTGFTTFETVEKAIKKAVPPSKSHLIEKNIEAVNLGYRM